jgi:hypothetical protein
MNVDFKGVRDDRAISIGLTANRSAIRHERQRYAWAWRVGRRWAHLGVIAAAVVGGITCILAITPVLAKVDLSIENLPGRHVDETWHQCRLTFERG